MGILVEPPTRITSWMSEVDRPASLSAFMHGSTVLSTRSATNSSNLARVSVKFRCLGPDESAVTKGRLISVCLELDNSFFAASAASLNLCSAIGSLVKSIPSLDLNSLAIQLITF